VVENSQDARARLIELSEDPEYRPFILGYLIQALDERYWPLLVQVALEHVERLEELQSGSHARVRALLVERLK